MAFFLSPLIFTQSLGFSFLFLVVFFLLVRAKTYRELLTREKILSNASHEFLSASDFQSACQIAIDAIDSLFNKEIQVRVRIATSSADQMIVIAASPGFAEDPIGQAVSLENIGGTNNPDKTPVRSKKSEAWTVTAIPLNIKGTIKSALIIESSKPVSDELLNPLRYIGANLEFVLEITSLRKSLTEEQDKNKKLIEEATDIIFVTDATGRFSYVNATASKITGYDHEVLVGQHYWNLIRTDYREEANKFYRQQLKETSPITYFEFPIITKEGKEVWIGQNVSLIIEDGSTQGVRAIARDITLQKRMEEEALKSKEYMNLFKLANDAIIIFEPEGERILDANDKALAMYGFSREDFIGKSLKDLSENNLRGDAYIRKLLSDKTHQEFETVQFRSDGTPLSLNINSSIIKYRERQAVLSINRDVTDRKRIEEALRESEMLFRSLAETISIGIVLYNADQVLYVNSALETLTGYNKEELLSIKIWELLPPDHKESFNSSASNSPNEYATLPRQDFLSRRKSGEKIWFDVSTSVTTYKGARTMLVAIVNITERKKAEEALRASEERFSRVFQLSPYPKAILSFIDGKYLNVNDSLLATTGYSREEMIGRTSTDLGLWFDTADRDRIMQSVREQGRLRNVEVRFRTKHGDVCDVLLSAETIELNEQKCLIIVCNDITDRKLIESALREAELRYRKVFEHCPVGIVIIDPQTTFIVNFNGTACNQLGYTPDEFAKLRITDFEVGKTPSEITTCVDELIDKGTLSFETLHSCKNGEIRNVMVTAQLIDLSGKTFCISIFYDITERKKAEMKLRASEARLRDAQSIAHLGDWELDFTSNNLTWSDEVFRICQADPMTFRPSYGAFLDLVHYEDRAMAATAFSESIKSKTRVEMVYRLMMPDGNIKFVEGCCETYYNSIGNPMRSVGTLQDITESKMMLNTLQKLSSAVEHIADCVIITDRNGIIEYVNRAFETITGYTKDEAIGESPRILKSGKHTTEVYEELWDEILKGKVFHGTLINRKKNGELFYEEMTITPLQDQDSNITHFVLTGRDITDRKRIEADRSELEAKVRKSAIEWRDTFDTVELPVMIVDRLSRIVRLNRSAKELIKHNYNEIIGQQIGEVALGEPWGTAKELVQKVKETRSSASSQAKDLNTGRSWELDASTLIMSEFNEEHIILVAYEITSIVELQESLRKSELVAAMGGLVAGVAHEVRNPLFGISATLDAFEETLKINEEFFHQSSTGNYVHKECFGYISSFREALDRLNYLMEELLEYGKPSIFEYSPCCLKDIIVESVRINMSLARQMRVNIEYDQTSELELIRVDRGRMVQVFRNLIENAIQHSPPTSSINIINRQVSGEDAHWIECVIEDQGPGFNPKDLPRIFEPFFTRRRGGTGLGMSIVQRIIEGHGGRISLANRPGGGAAVMIQIPIAE